MKGHGFSSSNIDVKIDGVACQIVSNDLESFQCVTGSQPTPSTDKFFVGQHGLRRKLINSTYPVDFTNITASKEYTEIYAPDFESPQNVKQSGYGNIYSGYFKAPATANYRFYMSCDDGCQLYLSNGTSLDPATKQLLYSQMSPSSYRQYFTIGNWRLSNWVSLQKDETLKEDTTRSKEATM